MAFDSQGSRIKALERALVGNTDVVVVITPRMPADEVAARLALVEEAKAHGRPYTLVQIRAAKPRPAATTVSSSDE
jgi:hypothetical protein